MTGKFKKWKIFHNPPGWSNTNSNIKSFNAVIKRDFTLRRRYSVYASVEMMEDIILYYKFQSNIKRGRKKIDENNGKDKVPRKSEKMPKY